ncbi:family 16 glycosylhydrolase [Nocardioides sp. GCM10030258]|uniref:glycoside hydrolase family 16 protein n=1 Tax=unclassified Nocardioides TaxID=2615069 RepID=UPI00360AD01E
MIRARIIGTLVAASAALATMTIVGAEPTAAGPPTRLSCGGEKPLKVTGGKYACSFEEDFNGTSLDSTKWMVQDTALSGMPAGTDGCYVNNADHVKVADGVLSLTSRIQPEPFTCKSPYGDFQATKTTSTVASWGKFAQTYGRFDFRAKFPVATAPGVHSALWLYPQDQTYGGWPKSGEIDVAEWFTGDPTTVYPSVHYEGEDQFSSTGFNCPVPGADSGFHRYGVEWTPTVMRFFYDGNLCFSHSWTPEAPLTGSQPFDKPFYLVMTQVFGSGWNLPTASTPTTATMQVDWVRVWR